MSGQPEAKRHLINLQGTAVLVPWVANCAVFILDAQGRILSWTDEASQYFGYREAEALGLDYSKVYSLADQQSGIPTQDLHSAAERIGYESRGWRARKDGTVFPANYSLQAIYAPDGTLAGYLSITCDLSAQHASDAASFQREQQFRLLVQSVTDSAIFMLDQNGNVASWNPGAQRIKGYTEAEIIGTHFSRFYTADDQQAGLPEAALAAARSTGRFEHEARRVRKDGTSFLGHVVMEPIRNDGGQVIGYAKVTRDVTAAREAAQALDRTEKALLQAQKMETLGKLTGGVAHDFNNVLQVIGSNLQLLLRELPNDESARRRLQSALSGVNRGAKLAKYLLAFGRRQALEPKVVNLGRFVRSLEDLLQRAIGESIEVETVVAGGLWNTCVDLTQVETAVLNLAVNGRDAMGGAGKLTLEVGNALLDDTYARAHVEVTAGQYVMLAVSDTGTGMTPEVLAQAFEPFFSTKPEGAGTGLGLSMVYGFVKQSGGHVKIYSEVGLGTTIKIYLPRSHEIEDLPQPTERPPAVGGIETILVVEDDEQVRTLTVELLTDLGYHVLRAGDAEAALSIIQSGIKIDLLFTDVVMPGSLRTPELARKAREFLPGIAVLYTSGYTQNAIVHGGRLDPGVELLGKPYGHEELARKVRECLATQRSINQS